MFATYIKEILHTIIHADHKVFIPERSKGENIEILSITDQLQIEDKPDLLISIDVYKAFDTKDWLVTQKALKYSILQNI